MPSIIRTSCTTMVSTRCSGIDYSARFGQITRRRMADCQWATIEWKIGPTAVCSRNIPPESGRSVAGVPICDSSDIHLCGAFPNSISGSQIQAGEHRPQSQYENRMAPEPTLRQFPISLGVSIICNSRISRDSLRAPCFVTCDSGPVLCGLRCVTPTECVKPNAIRRFVAATLA